MWLTILSMKSTPCHDRLMPRRRIVDLFSGAGGAGEGYRQAGFPVTAVDTVWQINSPHRFVQLDALKANLANYTLAHASPPCQRWSKISSRNAHKYPDLLTPTRQKLIEWGGFYVIENVPDAPLRDPVLVCGAALGLGAVCRDGVYRVLRRHRMFESNMPLK